VNKNIKWGGTVLTLVKVQVWKYKSIEDSTPVDIARDVTVLVGKNESGKTAFLEAMHKALPLGSASFNYIADYPRKDLVKYRPKHESQEYSKVIELTFKIEKVLAEKINREVFDSAQIVHANQLVTRTTTIGNSQSIGFSIPGQAAFDVIAKPFLQSEQGKAVFTASDSLETTLDRIEALGLPADDALALFAALWRSRTAKNSNWGLIEGYVWRKYVFPALPKFLYFDDYKLLSGKVNLIELRDRTANSQLTDTDETVSGLLELAGTDVNELMSEEGYEAGKAKLEAISLSITQNIFNFWKQNQDLDVEFDIKTDSKDIPPFNNGPNLYIRIKNRRHGVTVPFDQRSKGFIWFFSFLVWFDAVQSRVNTDNALVLLLDEPGLNLHALAQADFLSYIEALAQDHQIVFSTHSPFMVDSAKLENVRVVEDMIKEGTKVTSELAGSSEESIFPLQAALGYSIAQNLFISKKNILIEGPADLIVLQHMAALLEAEGKRGVGDATLVPVGGLDKLATFVALLGASKLKIAVLHDRASAPHRKLDDLIRQKLIEKKRVIDFSMFLEPQPNEADIEDLIPEAIYIEAFNEAYTKELGGSQVTAAELVAHPRIVERINLWLKGKSISVATGGGYNHYRVAQKVLGKLTTDRLAAADLVPFEKLFNRVHDVF